MYLTFIFVAMVFVYNFLDTSPVQAAPGINQQMNYQARLLNNTGAVVPDGTYNLEFKIYQDGTGCTAGGTTPCSGTLKWTEARTGANKVTVTNGYFSVQLGEITAFGSSVDWNQDTLWLSINVGGTGAPTWDGEMTPFRRLAASPYALNAGQLGGRSAASFLQLAPTAVQADNSTLSSVFVNKTGSSGNILQLQKGGADVLTVSNNGALTVNGSYNSNTFNASNLQFGAAATATVQSAAGQALTITGNATSSWSTSAGSLSLQGAAGLNLTSGTGNVQVGVSDTSGTLLVLDTKTNAGDPTGVNGGIYYSSAAQKFRCYQNSAWTDCISTGASTLQQVYDTGNTVTATDNRTLLFSLADTTTDPNFLIDLQCDTACATNGRFAILEDGVDVFTVSPSTGVALFKNKVDSATALQIQNAAGTSNAFVADTSNLRVGVGNVTPTETLHINGKMRFVSPVENSWSGNAKIFVGTGPEAVAQGDLDATSLSIINGFGNGGGNIEGIVMQWGGSEDSGGMKVGDDGLMVWGAGDEDLFHVLDEDANATRLVIDDGGAVGIGTANPSNAVHIDRGTAGATVQVTAGGTSGTGATDGLQLTIDGSNNGYLMNQENASLILGTNAQARMTITAAGDVNVGTADTTGALLVLDTKTGAGDPTGTNGGLYYNANMGKFRCYESGVWKQCSSTTLRVAADVSSTDAVNWANVTGLTANVNAGETYTFRCMLTYTTAISTTAINLSANGPATTALDYGVFVATTATTIHSSSQTAYNTVTNPGTGGGATRLTAEMSGTFIPSAAGTFAIRLKSEVAASAVTVKRGSFCVIE